MNEEREQKYLDGSYCCPKCSCTDFYIADNAHNRESNELAEDEPVQCELCGFRCRVEELHLWATKGVH